MALKNSSANYFRKFKRLQLTFQVVLNTFATINRRHAPHSTQRGYDRRRTPASPRPVTNPSRAHMSCTAAISGKENNAVQSGR